MPKWAREKLIRVTSQAVDCATELEMIEWMQQEEREELLEIRDGLQSLAARAKVLSNRLSANAEKRGIEIKKTPEPVPKFGWLSHERKAKRKKKESQLRALEEQLQRLQAQLENVE